MKLGERNPGLLARNLETMNGEFNGEVDVSPKQNFCGETKQSISFITQRYLSLICSIKTI